MGELANEIQDAMMLGTPLNWVSTLGLLFSATAPVTPSPATQTPKPVDHARAPTPQSCQPSTCKGQMSKPSKQPDVAKQAKATDRKMISASIGQQTALYFRRCAPGGVDANLIVTRLSLRIDQTGRLIDAIFVGQDGVNDLNRPLAGMHKRCAINSARAASPYRNLPTEHYEQWKNWPLHFKSR